MKSSKLPRDLLIVSILTVITVCTWIIFDVHRALIKSEVPKVLREQIEPLNPELDAQIFENLSRRVLFKKEEMMLQEISPTPEATSTIQP
jgi:hypothetical protein